MSVGGEAGQLMNRYVAMGRDFGFRLPERERMPGIARLWPEHKASILFGASDILRDHAEDDFPNLSRGTLETM
jgi:hypothetical protein